MSLEISKDETDTNYWTKSAWKTVTNPNTDSGFATDLTSQLSNLSNSKYWSKTHYGSLDGSTVNSSYTRGDNIYYQGKHYVYTSHLDSNDPLYVDPTNDGYTEFSAYWSSMPFVNFRCMLIRSVEAEARITRWCLLPPESESRLRR